jgi:LmbE family N-acetylglucosaminyl deacetylase
MKIVTRLLLSVAAFYLFFNFQVKAEGPVKKPVAIFYSPHQDDELLSMGHAITMYVQKGYDVHVVLLTDGSGSSSIHSVNEEMSEYYLEPLSTEEFSYARNLEFVRSLTALGVQRNHLHFSRLKDGKTTLNEVEEIVLKYESRFPDALHMAISYHDNHIDHHNSGQALLSLYNSGMIQEPKFYIQNNERELYKEKYGYEQYSSLYDHPIQLAKKPYLDWNPLRRMYSIGALSVPHDFKLLDRDPRSMFHGPGL